MRPAHTHCILGYHGCDKKIAERILSGEFSLAESTNDYDWLGHGIYFWEDDPQRAIQWASERMEQPQSSIQEPAVIGAALDLGHCFSLMRADHLDFLKDAYQVLAAWNSELPSNVGGKDKFLRRLDCAVIQTLHAIREEDGEKPIDSIRGQFQEGTEIYPGASFREKSHVQICIRNPDCIKGFFRPIGF